MKNHKKPRIMKKDEAIGYVVIKIAAAATGRYQPQDVGPVFKMLSDEMHELAAPKTSRFTKEEVRDMFCKPNVIF